MADNIEREMQKSDIIGWAAILGSIALFGYIGVKAVRGLFPGAPDIFGNISAAQEQALVYAKAQEASENLIQNAEAYAQNEVGGAYENYPQYQAAWDAYQKENKEYCDMLRAYQVQRSWTGRVTTETKEYYARMNAEYIEAQDAYANLMTLHHTLFGATQA